MIAKFPKTVMRMTPMMETYMIPRTVLDLRLSGQDLFPNSEQSIMSLVKLKKDMIFNLKIRIFHVRCTSVYAPYTVAPYQASMV